MKLSARLLGPAVTERNGNALAMMGITVQGGLHDGAVVALAEHLPRRVGSAADADILLVDEAVDERQCTLLWRGGDTVELEVTGKAMDAYGRELATGRVLQLPAGAIVSVATVSLMTVRLQHPSQQHARPVLQPPSAEELLLAHRRVLKQLHWAIYAGALLRSNTWVLRGAAGLAGTALLALATLHLLGAEPGDAQLRAEVTAQIQALFPAVEINPESTSGVVIYEGYVRDTRELNQLRSIALGITAGRAVVRVLPMDVLEFNASTWLDTYYQDAQIESVGPGKLKVRVASEFAIKRLDGWDFDSISRRLMHELEALRSVSIALAESDHPQIPLPAAQLGVSFVPLHDGAVYAVGADGTPLYPGAVTSDGRVLDISGCGLSLRSFESGSVFLLSAQNARCAQQHIPPVQKLPPIDSGRGNEPR